MNLIQLKRCAATCGLIGLLALAGCETSSKLGGLLRGD